MRENETLQPYYVIISVDVERAHGVKYGLPKLLDLFMKHGIKATFFITGYIAERFPELIKALLSEGHEVGCHSYMHENLVRLPATTKREIIEKATEIISQLIGATVSSFRAPYFKADTELMLVLESLGYKIDSSLANFYCGHLIPYHPAKDNWLCTGHLEEVRKILEIPISIYPKQVCGRINSKVFYGYVPFTLRVMLYKKLDPFRKMVKTLNIFLKNMGYPGFLVMDMHPWELVRREEALVLLNSFLEFLEEVFDVRYVTMSEFYSMWESNYCPIHACKGSL